MKSLLEAGASPDAIDDNETPLTIIEDALQKAQERQQIITYKIFIKTIKEYKAQHDNDTIIK